MPKRLTNEEFLKRCKEWGKNLIYDKTVYKSYEDKVIVTCPIHGDFEIGARLLLHGYGCKKCGIKNKPQCQKKSNEQFLKELKEIHDDRYTPLEAYDGVNTKIKIKCNKCGKVFTDSPHMLIGKKRGCPYCNGGVRLTTQVFIERAKKVHGNKYDYSKVNYINSITPITIICPKHGEFQQKSSEHLINHGCQKCAESRLEEEIRILLEENKIKYVYQYRAKWLDRLTLDFYLPDYKIGIECQGIQHFEPTDFAGKGEEWAKQQLVECKIRDADKAEKCKNNGIKLLYHSNEHKLKITDIIKE